MRVSMKMEMCVVVDARVVPVEAPHQSVPGPPVPSPTLATAQYKTAYNETDSIRPTCSCVFVCGRVH